MIRTGLPRQAFERAVAADTLALSRAVRDEIVEVLNRPKLARYVDPVLREGVLAMLVATAQWFEPDISITDCRDAKDNKYLELALAAGATTLASSDEDLLVLHPWRGVTILRPAAYVALA